MPKSISDQIKGEKYSLQKATWKPQLVSEEEINECIIRGQALLNTLDQNENEYGEAAPLVKN